MIPSSYRSLSTRIAAYLRQNVLGLVAIFIALTGTAYAAGNLPKNSVGASQLKNGAITGKKVKDGSLTGTQINASTLATVPSATHAISSDQLGGSPASAFQARISAGCQGNNAIQSISPLGAVSCQPTGAGTITGITAGTDLTGGGSSGNITLNADETLLQHRIGNSCPSGQAIASVAQNGVASCQPVGTITAVTAGTGLTGGGSSGPLTLNADETVLQHRLDSGCPSGKAIQSVDQSGNSTCSPPLSVTQILGGSIGSLQGNVVSFLAPSGLSSPSPTDAAVTEGLSANATTAGNLFVNIDAAPGNGNEWSFILKVNNILTNVSCTIFNTSTSCSNSGGTAVIPAGATVDLLATQNGLVPATRATFGWTATS